jgi:hypothetical protein
VPRLFSLSPYWLREAQEVEVEAAATVLDAANTEEEGRLAEVGRDCGRRQPAAAVGSALRATAAAGRGSGSGRQRPDVGTRRGRAAARSVRSGVSSLDPRDVGGLPDGRQAAVRK